MKLPHQSKYTGAKEFHSEALQKTVQFSVKEQVKDSSTYFAKRSKVEQKKAYDAAIAASSGARTVCTIPGPTTFSIFTDNGNTLVHTITANNLANAELLLAQWWATNGDAAYTIIKSNNCGSSTYNIDDVGCAPAVVCDESTNIGFNLYAASTGILAHHIPIQTRADAILLLQDFLNPPTINTPPLQYQAELLTPCGSTFDFTLAACNNDGGGDAHCHPSQYNPLTQNCCEDGYYFCQTSQTCEPLPQDCTILEINPATCTCCPDNTYYCATTQTCIPATCPPAQFNPLSCDCCPDGQYFCYETQTCTDIPVGCTLPTVNPYTCECCEDGYVFCWETLQCIPQPCEYVSQYNPLTCECCPDGSYFCYETQTCEPLNGCHPNQINPLTCECCPDGSYFCWESQQCEPLPQGCSINGVNTLTCECCSVTNSDCTLFAADIDGITIARSDLASLNGTNDSSTGIVNEIVVNGTNLPVPSVVVNQTLVTIGSNVYNSAFVDFLNQLNIGNGITFSYPTAADLAYLQAQYSDPAEALLMWQNAFHINNPNNVIFSIKFYRWGFNTSLWARLTNYGWNYWDNSNNTFGLLNLGGSSVPSEYTYLNKFVTDFPKCTSGCLAVQWDNINCVCCGDGQVFDGTNCIDNPCSSIAQYNPVLQQCCPAGQYYNSNTQSCEDLNCQNPQFCPELIYNLLTNGGGINISGVQNPCGNNEFATAFTILLTEQNTGKTVTYTYPNTQVGDPTMTGQPLTTGTWNAVITSATFNCGTVTNIPVPGDIVVEPMTCCSDIAYSGGQNGVDFNLNLSGSIPSGNNAPYLVYVDLLTFFIVDRVSIFIGNNLTAQSPYIGTTSVVAGSTTQGYWTNNGTPGSVSNPYIYSAATPGVGGGIAPANFGVVGNPNSGKMRLYFIANSAAELADIRVLVEGNPTNPGTAWRIKVGCIVDMTDCSVCGQTLPLSECTPCTLGVTATHDCLNGINLIASNAAGTVTYTANGSAISNGDILAPGIYTIVATDSNCSVQTTLTVLPTDLRLSVSADHSSVEVFELIKFTLTLTNESTTDAYNVRVRVTDTLGFGSYVSSSGSGIFSPFTSTWTPNGNAAQNYVVLAGETKTITLTYQATQAGTFNYSAEIVEACPADSDSIVNNNVPAEDDQDSVSYTATCPTIVLSFSCAGGLQMTSNGNLMSNGDWSQYTVKDQNGATYTRGQVPPNGTYTFTITHNTATNCVTTAANIVVQCCPTITPGISYDCINGLQLGASGGTAPYTYTYNGTPLVQGQALQATQYNILITDANNCTANYVLNIPCNSTVNIVPVAANTSGTFEQTANPVPNFSYTTESIATDARPGSSGTRSGQYVHTTNITATTTDLFRTDSITPLCFGRKYRFRGWVKIVNLVPHATAGAPVIHVVMLSSNYTETPVQALNMGLIGQWQEVVYDITVDFLLPVGNVTGALAFRLASGGIAPNTTFRYDDFTITEVCQSAPAVQRVDMEAIPIAQDAAYAADWQKWQDYIQQKRPGTLNDLPEKLREILRQIVNDDQMPLGADIYLTGSLTDGSFVPYGKKHAEYQRLKEIFKGGKKGKISDIDLHIRSGTEVTDDVLNKLQEYLSKKHKIKIDFVPFSGENPLNLDVLRNSKPTKKTTKK